MRLTTEQATRLEDLAAPLLDYVRELRAQECAECDAMTEEERELHHYSYDDAELSQTARSLAREVLETAQVDGLGGCLLCQG